MTIAPELAKALVAAQKATESVKKAASNPAFKSKYADLAHVVEGVVPALNANGVAVIQSPEFDGEMVHVTTMLVHESGATLEGKFSLRPSKLDPQGVGSALTYARRYALLAMTGAAPEDDDGSAASGPRQEAPPRSAPKRAEPPAPTLAQRADRLIATLTTCKPEEVEKAWGLAQRLRDELAEADPDTLEKLRKTYEFRRPDEQAAA